MMNRPEGRITTRGKSPKPRQNRSPPAGGLHWRGTVISIAGALVVSIICLNLLDTVVRQVTLIVPHAATARERQTVRAAHRAWESDRSISTPIARLHALSQRDPTDEELAKWTAADPADSLPVWAELLVRLRASGIGPEPPAALPGASLTVIDPHLSELIRRLEHAGSLRIRVGAAHETFIAAARDRGLSARRAEMLFAPDRYGPVLSAYRPVLRELTARLMALGRELERADRLPEARRVYGAVVRLLTEAVADSPLPEVALLAADRLQAPLGKIEADSAASNALERFRHGWMQVPDGKLAIMPATFGPALAPELQERTLSSLVASVALLSAGWLLALVCLVLLIIVMATGSYGPIPLAWRGPGWGAWVAPLIVVVPVLCVQLTLACSEMPFVWLLSGRSLGAVLLVPGMLFLLSILAVQTCVRPLAHLGGAGLPLRAVGGVLGLLALLVIGVVLLLPVHQEVWRPPVSVQLFRRLSVLTGLGSLLAALIWAGWGFRRRRRAGMPPGAWARAHLAVCSVSMLAFLLAAAVWMGVNQRNDRLHEQSFYRAVSAPIAQRLGPAWWDEYFAPARQTVSQASD